ncbi:MAG: N-acetylmuramoyl-L-alanine amidase [Bacteroidales bacterium]|nr:N-acetylmuramoyl-L-alanine amidase [Bacteroidales bacterium]
MKRFILIFSVIFIASVVVVFSQSTDKKQRIRTVVIDAGHGGHDPGAVGSKYKEKDIALAIALKFGGYIEQNMPDIKVAYTRKTDEFIELHRRAQIANQSKADLFISIHCNAARNRQAYGAETFVMGIHRSQENLEVAKLENAVILLEDNVNDVYEGFDPNSPESNIIFSLFQNIHLDQSLLFARKVQDQFRERVGREDRGVKQAGFWVLYKAAATGILIETGFVSNPEEEEFLGSEQGQAFMASAIFRAFKEYKERIEGQSFTNSSSQNGIDTVQTHEEVVIENNSQIDTSQNNIRFRVQFAASSTNKPLNSSEFSGLSVVKVYFQNGLYRYTSGNFITIEEAQKWQVDLQNKGFRDAFIVAFQNEQRISREDALRLIKNN